MIDTGHDRGSTFPDWTAPQRTRRPVRDPVPEMDPLGWPINGQDLISKSAAGRERGSPGGNIL